MRVKFCSWNVARGVAGFGRGVESLVGFRVGLVLKFGLVDRSGISRSEVSGFLESVGRYYIAFLI